MRESVLQNSGAATCLLELMDTGSIDLYSITKSR